MKKQIMFYSLIIILLSFNSLKAQSNEKIFNWSNIIVSKKDIGVFPYFKLAKKVTMNNDMIRYDFNKLEMYDGNSFYPFEGSVAKVHITMKNQSDEWDKTFFRRSISEYLISIGAIMINSDEIYYEHLENLNESNTKNVYDYIIGDPWNLPIDMYVLKTDDKKIGFQVYSGYSEGMIGIVELKDFNQTIKKIDVFPYIKIPIGLTIENQKSLSSGKLEMFNGKMFFPLEGITKKMVIRMDNPDFEWNRYFFDKSINHYLKQIGADLIYNKKISNYKLEQLNKVSNNYVQEHIIGDPWNDDATHMYILERDGKKIGFQIFSNSSRGEIGIVEMKESLQITAKKMKDEIFEKGSVSLYINFDAGNSNIKKGSYAIIDQIVIMMKNERKLSISIEGHTDSVELTPSGSFCFSKIDY